MIDDNNSRSIIRFILPFAILLFLIPAILIKTCNENTDEKKYFDDLNLELTGIIKYVDRPNASNGFGVIGVDIISCNKNHIDQRKKETIITVSSMETKQNYIK